MNLIIQDLLGPLTRRLGTATSAFLIGYGVDHASADMVAAGLGAAIMIVAELILDRSTRDRTHTEGVVEGLRRTRVNEELD